MNEKKDLTIEEIFDLAVKNQQKNNFQTAENLYNEVLKINPNHFKSIYGLATLFAQAKKFDLAKTLFNKAVQIQPNNAMAHNNLGPLAQIESLKQLILDAAQDQLMPITMGHYVKYEKNMMVAKYI